MKSLWTALSLLLLLHAMALVGFVGWLKVSGRLDRQRLVRTREIYTLTLAQEKQQAEQATQLASETKAKALEAARLESIAANGAVSLAERLKADQQADDMAMQRVERLQRDIADLRRQLVLAKDLLAKQKAELEAQRQEFEAAAKRERDLHDQADFQQAVQTYEQLKPRQVKEMFQTLIKEGKTRDVIDYLAAMQLRKAAAVLKEFKTPEEIPQATDLVQRLRERGVDPPLEKPDLVRNLGQGTT